MKSSVTISMDSELKKEAESLFSDLGMNFTTAVNVFVRQAVNRQRLPFTVKRINYETLAAIEEGRRIARDPNTRVFTSTDELFKELSE